MAEADVDIATGRPRHLEFSDLPRFERIIALGPAVVDTDPDLPLSETWTVEDPANQDLETYRRVRDHLRTLVGRLADEIREWDPAA